MLSPNLLSLPELVRNRLLSYLEGSDLLTLRQVCTITNSWVSQLPSKTAGRVWNNYVLTVAEKRKDQDLSSFVVPLSLIIPNLEIQSKDLFILKAIVMARQEGNYPSVTSFSLAHLMQYWTYNFDFETALALQVFPELVVFCAERNINLRSVPAPLLNSVETNVTKGKLGPGFLDTCRKVITGIINVTPDILTMKLECLESLTLCSTNFSTVRHHNRDRDIPTAHMQWMDNLKTLSVNFDTNTRVTHYDQRSFDRWNLSQLQKYLFGHGDGRVINRIAVRELNVKFERNLLTFLIKEKRARKNISFQSLLTMSNLEEVWIEDCRRLGDEGFVGTEDEDEPVFLMLAKLKKLTLNKLDRMHGISDRSFRDVFSKMNISHFTLHCDDPLLNITRDGIRLLAKEPFSVNVKHLKINGLTMPTSIPMEFERKMDVLWCSGMFPN